MRSVLSIKKVKMKDGTERLRLKSPYHPDIPNRMRQLGGSWSYESRTWYVPVDLEAELRQICYDIYRIDPLGDAPEMVNVRYSLGGRRLNQQTLFLFGREIVHRPGRDSSVKPGPGVSIISGGFLSSGGSRNNPILGYSDDDTVILIRDVPREAADEFAQVEDGVVEIEELPEAEDADYKLARRLAHRLVYTLDKLSSEEQAAILEELQGELAKIVDQDREPAIA